MLQLLITNIIISIFTIIIINTKVVILQSYFCNSSQKFPNPLILWRPLILLNPPPPFFFSKFYPPITLQPRAVFLVLPIWLNMWSRQIYCDILLFDMELKLLTLSTLVPGEPCSVFYARRNQIYWRLI